MSSIRSENPLSRLAVVLFVPFVLVYALCLYPSSAYAAAAATASEVKASAATVASGGNASFDGYDIYKNSQGTEMRLTGDLTLTMDEDLTLWAIRGDGYYNTDGSGHALTIQGDGSGSSYVLTLNTTKKSTISCGDSLYANDILIDGATVQIYNELNAGISPRKSLTTTDAILSFECENDPAINTYDADCTFTNTLISATTGGNVSCISDAHGNVNIAGGNLTISGGSNAIWATSVSIGDDAQVSASGSIGGISGYGTESEIRILGDGTVVEATGGSWGAMSAGTITLESPLGIYEPWEDFLYSSDSGDYIAEPGLARAKGPVTIKALEEISTVDIGNIWTALDPINNVPFTAEVHDELDSDGVNFNDKMEIIRESWWNVDDSSDEVGYWSDVTAQADATGKVKVNNTYSYTIGIAAKPGYVFTAPPSSKPWQATFTCILGGSEVTLATVAYSDDYKRVFFTPIRGITVEPVNISSATVSGITDKTYTGKAQTQSPTVKMNVNGTNVTLKNGTDYTISYANNTNAGTATVTIAGKGNYTGTVSKTFKIAPAAITSVTASPASYAYDGSAKKPALAVKAGSLSVPSGSYTAVYSNNTNAGTATVKVSGKGNFTGSASASFTITQASDPAPTPTPDPTPSPSPAPAPVAKQAWVRVAGDNQYDTMEQVSSAGWDGADTVVLATGENFPDALAAAGVAGMEGAPVLITASSKGTLSEQARSELARLAPKKIIVVGGIYAMPQSVVDAACAAAGGASYVRLAGDHASDTAAAMNAAYAGRWSGDAAFLATSLSFPDALSAAPLAYSLGMPIYLVDHWDSVSEATYESMEAAGISKLYVLGGVYCVSEAAVADIEAHGVEVAGRLAGDTLYDTSLAIAEWGVSQGMGADKMGVACGQNYPDALTGAAFCGRNGAVMALADSKDHQTCLPVASANKGAISYGHVFGGKYAVPYAVQNAYEEASGCPTTPEP